LTTLGRQCDAPARCSSLAGGYFQPTPAETGLIHCFTSRTREALLQFCQSVADEVFVNSLNAYQLNSLLQAVRSWNQL